MAIFFRTWVLVCIVLVGFCALRTSIASSSVDWGRNGARASTVYLEPFGRNPLFPTPSSPPADDECGGRGYLVGRGADDAECVCHVGFGGNRCAHHHSADPTFAISYLMYGANTFVEATVANNIKISHNHLSKQRRVSFVVFHDRFPAKRLKPLEKAPLTSLVSVALPRHINGSCSCAPYGVVDAHCHASDAEYRGMGMFRAVHQFRERELMKFTYVIVMDAEAHFLGGDPFGELLRSQSGFGFYAWGANNHQSCMGNVREWAVNLVATWGVQTAEFVSRYGTTSPDCATRRPNILAACCGVRVSSFSGDVVAFRTDVMRAPSVRRMIDAWATTSLLRDNRSTEQELWPNLFGLLLPRGALHQFSPTVQLNAHMGFEGGGAVSCELPSGVAYAPDTTPEERTETMMRRPREDIYSGGLLASPQPSFPPSLLSLPHFFAPSPSSPPPFAPTETGARSKFFMRRRLLR